MWVKVLGLVCAGVFVGAVLVEAKQLRRRKRRKAHQGSEPETAPRDDADRDDDAS